MSNYEQKIAAGLQKAYDQQSARASFDVATDKWVLFSDHHKGQRDGADDFNQCEKAYNAALGYYFEKGYTLVILGDGEELWECSPKKVMRAYRTSLELEAQFFAAAATRYLRFWGNHDSDWKREGAVAKYLRPIFGNSLQVHEAMRVQVHVAGLDLGEIFLVHGHQGTIESDQYSFISRLAVRYGWGTLQRIFKMKSTTPAKDFLLRHKHNIAMYRWVAEKAGVILIAGHTHRPVFKSRNRLAELQDQLTSARAALNAAGPNPPTELSNAVANLRAQIESARVQELQYPSGDAPITQARPCYFNTGCCSFSDGDVTAIEIADGRMALVRWPDDQGDPKRKELIADDLRVVFEKVSIPLATPQPAVPNS